MTILQSPEQVSLSMNILPFRLSSTEQVTMVLLHGEEEILSQVYEPDADGIVEIDLRDIIHNRLSVLLSDSSEVYIQPNLVGDFTASFGTTSYNFRVVRGGVENLADSSINFLMQNFLTWQPTVKKVTYSSPEFLTYYSMGSLKVVLKAYYIAADGSMTDETLDYASLEPGKAYTIPMQYAAVSSRLGSKLPSYYDVWVENTDGSRVTYVQRYQADNAKSLHEDWFLFENSLGGIDTFRAYGVDVMTAKHTHNVAEIAEESVEYRVDTERQHQKNTGYLLPAEARWLYDFFPSSRKYIYIDNVIRSIVVTESNVKRDNKLLPSGFSFTYKFADARPLLNLPRTDVPATMLDIQVPDLGSFTLPPRLVEIPRLPLTEGALFPVQSPYSEEWGTTTLASLATLIGSLLADSVGEGGGVGHIHNNLDLLSILSYIDKYLLVNGERIKAGYADVAGDTEDLKGRFLRKDKADVAAALITFAQGLFSKGAITIGKEGFAEGMSGFGGRIDENANAELESLRLRRFLEVPELRFNRTEVTLGNEWRSPGAGIIERVEPDTDENGNQLMTGTAWLKLEDGEYGAISVGDICQGIFHSLNSSENATEDSDDSKGNFQFAGFYTCYFTVTDIVGADNKEFRYQMRPISDSWSIAIHPSEAMTFNCYGSFTNPDRMTSQYTTRTYTRLLVHQNTWEIGASNIAMQWGDLSNLAIHGINMSGYSAYLNNIYMTGAVKQINAAGREIKVANDRGDYIPGEHYDYYDRVSYDGGLWLCVAEGGTNTVPSDKDSAWLNQVRAAQGITSHSHWKSSETPYPASTILKFADRIWISNKETSAAPFPLYTDPDGNYYKTPEGDYYIVSETQSADWELLLDASGLVDGADGASVEARYSADGTNWHFPYQAGDIYMQQRIGEDGEWSKSMPFVGEPGRAGADGKYPEYEFAKNESISVAPTTGWQDAPPPTGDGEWVWMRMRIVDPNTHTATTWSTPVRLKGDTGESIKPMGAWKSGMEVPKLGVVLMAKTSFLAKKATTRPPMFCLTDPDGNYYITPEGGYYLTGEMNTEDYDVLVQSGKDGSDGKDYEWIFFLTDKEQEPSTPASVQEDDYVPSGWTDDSTGISETMPYEYCCLRTKKDGKWSEYSKPSIWAKWGKDGVSPILADIDNEMESIALSPDGKTTASISLKTTVAMWQGTKKLELSGITTQSVSGISATANKATGEVTILIASGVAIAEHTNIDIIVSANVNGVTESRTLTFTLAGVRAGADGENATLYRIVVSTNSISKRKDGSYSVNTISAVRIKTDGKEYSECSDGTLKYSIDGGAETTIANNATIDVSKITSKIQFIFYNASGKVVDKETIPMIIDGVDGKNGENAIYADISNEMDSIALSPEGKTTAASTLETVVSMWNGQTQVSLKSIAVSAIEGVTANYNLATGKILFSIPKNLSLPEHSEFNIIVAAEINGKTEERTLTFTVAGIKAGADGKAAVLYKILLSVNSVTKKSDGTYSVDGVNAVRCKIEDGVTSITTEGKLKYLIDDKDPSKYETEIGNSVDIPSYAFADRVRFTFYNDEGYIVDRETVPMITDGAGFEMMGNWKSGLSVPLRGVVQMGGGTYVAKKATSRPPLFCYTDPDGNYYITPEGGYYLTGEVNTTDYETWAEKGEKGADGKDGVDGVGKDGVDGKDGAIGYSGCVTRTWNAYIATQTYRNDADAAPEDLEATGIRYLDVILAESSENASGYEAYECVKTCVGSNPIGQTYDTDGVSADGNWRTASNLVSAFIAKFIALDANIKFNANGQLVILDDSNKVVAGMTGSREDGNNVRIWAGAETPEDAPFKVYEDGSSYQKNAQVNGNIRIPWVTLTYGVIYRSEYVDVCGFNGSGVTDDKLILQGMTGAELLIAWGDDANGREMTIYNTVGMRGADVSILIPSGYAIKSGSDTYTTEFTIKAGYMYKMVGMESMWVVMEEINVDKYY